MRMDREIKELLYVLEDEINSHISNGISFNGISFNDSPNGLCRMLSSMEFKDVINSNEYNNLHDYLKNNNEYKRGKYESHSWGFWWIPGDWDIRLEFIKHLIKKNEKKWWQFWK